MPLYLLLGRVGLSTLGNSPRANSVLKSTVLKNETIGKLNSYNKTTD